MHRMPETITYFYIFMLNTQGFILAIIVTLFLLSLLLLLLLLLFFYDDCDMICTLCQILITTIYKSLPFP